MFGLWLISLFMMFHTSAASEIKISPSSCSVVERKDHSVLFEKISPQIKGWINCKELTNSITWGYFDSSKNSAKQIINLYPEFKSAHKSSSNKEVLGSKLLQIAMDQNSDKKLLFANATPKKEGTLFLIYEKSSTETESKMKIQNLLLKLSKNNFTAYTRITQR